MPRAVAAALLCVSCFTACGKDSPVVPAPPPSAGESVTGNERFGWTQPAADAVELAAIRYAVYIDGLRIELADARCDAQSATPPFVCDAPLPRMTAGSHLLELSSFILDGTAVLESARSGPLRVITTATTAVSPGARSIAFTTLDGLALQLEPAVDGLNDPVDVAFAPDGSLFVAEAGATIRLAGMQSAGANGSAPIGAGPGDRLLAIAVDPAFAETHHVFALISASQASDAAGPSSYLLLRFREHEGALLDRVVLLDGVPAAAVPRGALRFGPDGKLYLALDDGGVPQRAGDLASRNGKLLRLNADATTPADQANLTPVYAYGFRSPHALTWQPASSAIWLADDGAARDSLLYSLQQEGPRVRGRAQAAFRLPAGVTASAATFYRGAAIPAFTDNLFVASAAARQLLRMTFRPGDPLTIVSTERLLVSRIGAIQIVAQAPDGALYVGTQTTLSRVTVVPQ